MGDDISVDDKTLVFITCLNCVCHGIWDVMEKNNAHNYNKCVCDYEGIFHGIQQTNLIW
jgi:hypothetical protein